MVVENTIDTFDAPPEERMGKERFETDQMWIYMGPQHPFSHGLWTLKIKVDGEIVTDAEPVIGYLHRGWEKEAENRTYPKIIPMADRLCYSASMTYTHLYCRTVEKALGVEIPEKADYIRVVADEICRIQSHLMWLAAMGTDLGNLTIFLWAMREREYWLDLNVRLCGQRMTTNYTRIGGVRNDTTDLFDRDVIRVTELFEKRLWDIIDMIDDSSIYVSRMKGVGYLSREQCANLGLTGPAMRGCGLDFDLRRDVPYSKYGEMDFEVPVLQDGDAYARYRVRIEELFQSCEIIKQAMRKIKALGKNAPYRVKVPSKVPAGRTFCKLEDPRGESMMYLVSDGTDKPYRLKVRAPLFTNLSASRPMVQGCRVADVPVVMAMIDVCMGESDR
ncbi:MAG: NADH-quinone oxidoreductase subunit D [Candidatus Methanomethylophilaceae archaeon]|jgi:NADH-quinone oxidoreductase subunit D